MALPLTKNGTNGNGHNSAIAVTPVSADDTYAQEYGFSSNHLDDDELIEKYNSVMGKYPGALIAIDDHECGHWTMQVFSTELEKKVFQAKKITDLWVALLKLVHSR